MKKAMNTRVYAFLVFTEVEDHTAVDWIQMSLRDALVSDSDITRVSVTLVDHLGEDLLADEADFEAGL